jgi:mannose-6-phosphate isomerase-like protein (cupin superfamily)
MIISSDDAPIFRQDGVTAVGYASPSRGATDLSLWRLSLAPGETSPRHSLSREEVFLALAGSAVATIDGDEHPFGGGDCLVVAAGAAFVLAAGDEGLDAVCAMAAGGKATLLPDGPTISPPWAA